MSGYLDIVGCVRALLLACHLSRPVLLINLVSALIQSTSAMMSGKFK